MFSLTREKRSHVKGCLLMTNLSPWETVYMLLKKQNEILASDVLDGFDFRLLYQVLLFDLVI